MKLLVYRNRLFYTKSTKSMALSPSKKRYQGPTQVSFMIHTVRGEHLESQAVVVSVNENTFMLRPRTRKGQTRYYEAGYTTFIDVSSDIRFAVAVVTPNDRGKYFFHAFSFYDFKPSIDPTLQKTTMTTPAQSYELSVSIFTTPSPYSSTPSSPSSVYSSSPNKNSTKSRASARSSLNGSPTRLSKTYSSPKRTTSSVKSSPNSPSKTSPVQTKSYV